MTRLGYLLPTRERIMRGEPSGTALLDAARRARDHGFDSVWAGDSLLAKPRHDPLTLLAAVAGAVPGLEVGTAVLLPMLRNPVVLAHQLATIDQVSEGRLIVGAGIGADVPNVRAEFAAAGVPFEGRVGRMMEGFRLCRALWSGEPVDWDGRWEVDDGVLAPTPHRPGGPPSWYGAHADAAIVRTARNFDGWFPVGPDPETFASRRELLVASAREAGRDPAELTSAIYVTIAVDDDPDAASAQIDEYLAGYYNTDPKGPRSFQACVGGTPDDVMAYLRAFVDAGAEHIVLRLVGDHAELMSFVEGRRSELDG